jgi:Dihaem cytochrome c
LPTETWRQILERPQKHYGKELPKMISVTTLLIWDYLQTFSRPLAPEEFKPVYIEQSRYFKALHPQVDLPENISHRTCIECHTQANNFDFQTLDPKWENAN